ncbi:hypothetical protein ACFV6E_04290 [Streptomyces sp. NPDC059785]|uniref:hypothetical protein n=1 Tax=Streptomyces sp. NPDC059785 TaxID=3346945 RepID=UPI003653B45B
MASPFTGSAAGGIARPMYFRAAGQSGDVRLGSASAPRTAGPRAVSRSGRRTGGQAVSSVHMRAGRVRPGTVHRTGSAGRRYRLSASRELSRISTAWERIRTALPCIMVAAARMAAARTMAS